MADALCGGVNFFICLALSASGPQLVRGDHTWLKVSGGDGAVDERAYLAVFSWRSPFGLAVESDFCALVLIFSDPLSADRFVAGAGVACRNAVALATGGSVASAVTALAAGWSLYAVLVVTASTNRILCVVHRLVIARCIFSAGGSAKTRQSDTDNLVIQSDFSTRFNALGMKHEFIAGVEYLKEEAEQKRNFKEAVETIAETTGIDKKVLTKYFKQKFKEKTKEQSALGEIFAQLDEATEESLKIERD